MVYSASARRSFPMPWKETMCPLCFVNDVTGLYSHPTLSQRERVRVRGRNVKTEIRTRSFAIRLMGDAKLLAPYFTWENIMALAVFDDGGAVHDDGFHSRRMAAHFLGIDHIRQFLADQIVDLVGVEHRHVGGHPFFQDAAIEAQSLSRKPREFMHRFFQAEQILFAAPVAEDFGRRTMPEETIQVRAHVGADEAGVGLDHFSEQLRVSVG